MKRIIVTLWLFAIPTIANADWGNRLLSITCDSSLLMIEPFIAWNEDADKYTGAISAGQSVEGDTTFYYSDYKNRYNKDTGEYNEIHATCAIKKHIFEIRVTRNRELEILDNKKTVMFKKIDNVWDVYGFVYKVRFAKNKWSEYCVKDVDNAAEKPNWKPAQLNAKDTNCR